MDTCGSCFPDKTLQDNIQTEVVAFSKTYSYGRLTEEHIGHDHKDSFKLETNKKFKSIFKEDGLIPVCRSVCRSPLQQWERSSRQSWRKGLRRTDSGKWGHNKHLTFCRKIKESSNDTLLQQSGWRL